MAAVVVQLRTSAALVSALSENTSIPGDTKIWADNMAFDLPAPPYMTYSEPSKTSQGTTGRLYVDNGTFTIEIVDTAKAHCRLIGVLAMAALDNAALIIINGVVRYLRHNTIQFQTLSSVASGSPAQYKMIVEFEYMIAMNF